jgi:LysR family transcriptional regulator, regulator for metE and metH
MILETRHLRLVTAVTDHGTLTRAGRELNLTQSALSHALLDLERRLGAPLFHRVGKRMVPTAVGERLVVRARRVLQLLTETEEEALRIASGLEGLIRLSTECYTCYHWLPALMQAFGQRFPNVEVRIVAEATRRPFRALLEGRIDLAIVHNMSADARIRHAALFEDELVVLTPPDHPFARQAFVAPEELVAEHLLTYRLPLRDLSIYQQVLGPAGVTPRRVTQIELTEALIEMVRAGMGVAVLAQWAVAPYVQAGKLTTTRFTESGLHRHWSAALLRQPSVPLHLREFINLLRTGPTQAPAVATAAD